MRSSVLVDDVIKYWDRRPCNIRHSPAPVGTLEWSQQVTAKKYFVEPHIPGFAQFERWRGKRVLEVGCGIGTDLLEFLRAGAEVWAVDASLNSCELAWRRQIVELQGQNLANVCQLNAEENLPTGGAPYDLIYSFGVLHHTPSPERALQNMYKLLKHDGELRLMLYAKISLKNIFREQPEAQAGCPLARMYTGWQARKLLKKVGFFVQSVKKTHIFPWRVEDYVKYQYVKRWPYQLMPSWLFHLLENVAGHHLLIVAKKTYG